jgi:hypothetical protein
MDNVKPHLRSFDGLDRLLPSKVDVSDTVNLLESILFHDDICDNDAVVLVEQPDVSVLLYMHVTILNSISYMHPTYVHFLPPPS